MTQPRPYFSIVIPTRNRAHLLRYALQSALHQDFDDYEIVVSDNFSSDDTAKVVEEFAHPRLRYVRTSEALAMPDHWEFALNQPRGQFIGYLCDDDALTRAALPRAAAALKKYQADLVVLGWGKYNGANSVEVPLRNSVLMPIKRAGLVVKQSADVLPAMTRCRISNHLPLMLNCFCRREVVEQVRNETGRLFMLAPDYSFAALIQTALANWVLLDEPLRLVGEFAESIGTTQLRNRGESAKIFLKEFGGQSCFERTPTDLYIMSNILANTFLLCKHRRPALAKYEIDWPSYFEGCWLDLAMLADYGVDVREEREIVLRALDAQPPEIQRAARARIGSFGMRLLMLRGWKPPRFGPLRRLSLWFANWSYYRGEKYGFSNILEAAKLVSKLNTAPT